MKVQVYGHLEFISVPQPVLFGALNRPTLALVRSRSDPGEPEEDARASPNGTAEAWARIGRSQP